MGDMAMMPDGRTGKWVRRGGDVVKEGQRSKKGRWCGKEVERWMSTCPQKGWCCVDGDARRLRVHDSRVVYAGIRARGDGGCKGEKDT